MAAPAPQATAHPLYVPLGTGPITYESFMNTPMNDTNNSILRLTEAEHRSVTRLYFSLYNYMIAVDYPINETQMCVSIAANYIGWYILTGNIDLLQHEMRRTPISAGLRAALVHNVLTNTNPRNSNTEQHEV